MKYIWIIILIIAEIIWLLFSIKDAIYTYKFIKKHNHISFNEYMDWLEGYTISFIVLHLSFLFVYSLIIFIIEIK